MLGRMYIEAAEKFFGGKRADLARVLRDEWSTSAVYLWDEVVPLAAARKLCELSSGQLPVLNELYDSHGNIIRKKSKRRA